MSPTDSATKITDPGHPQNAREFQVWEQGRRQGHAEAVRPRGFLYMTQSKTTTKQDWPYNLGAIEGLGYLDGQRGLSADPPEDPEARDAYMQGYNGALEGYMSEAQKQDQTTDLTYADGLRRAAKICQSMEPGYSDSPWRSAVIDALDDVAQQIEREAANARSERRELPEAKKHRHD